MLAVPMRENLLLVVGVGVAIAMARLLLAMAAVGHEMEVVPIAGSYLDDVHTSLRAVVELWGLSLLSRLMPVAFPSGFIL